MAMRSGTHLGCPTGYRRRFRCAWQFLATDVLIASQFETLDFSPIRDSIRIMDSEKEAKWMRVSNSEEEVRRMLEDPAYARQVEAELEELEAELEALGEEEETYEFAEVDMASLPEEQLKARAALLDEQVAQMTQLIETNRRAVNIGLLQKANKAPRCGRLKKNGEPCRAPAVKGESLCHFHSSAAETKRHAEIQIDVLEDRESVQITLKQIMELVATGKMNSRDAAVLLRATQIAGAMLKPEKKMVQPAKGKPAQGLGVNAEEKWG